MKQETARETPEAGLENRVSRLSFADIPGQSRLFVQYQHDPLSLREFYSNAVHAADDLLATVPAVLENYNTDRAKLCDALTTVNSSVGASDATFANIEKLRRSDTVAVVTGQQAGLFSGPLYTIYKALSAVLMAERLERQGVSAVPVFWAATEDHDFAEVSEAFFRNAAGESFRTDYSPAGRNEGVAVGSVVIDDSITDIIASLFELLPTTEFASDARDLLTNTWRPGEGFGTAFGRTLAALLRKYGIIFFDPLHPELKRLVAPLYVSAIERSDEIVDRLIERSKALADAGFHSQVLIEPDYFPLFWHDEAGVRRSLRKRADVSFQAKDSQAKFDRDQLLKIAAEQPENFSPGVMLRAAVQDFLLPTVCYFGGGAEVAYFAQNSVVYQTLGRPVTPIFHRQSVTIVEPRTRRALNKFERGLGSLFEGEESFRLGIADKGDPAAVFAEAEEVFAAQLDRISKLVDGIDSTLTKSVAKREQKIAYHVAAIKKKALLARIRRDEVTDRQIREMFSSLLPNGHLQERHFNIFDLVARYGLGIVDEIYRSLDIDERGHTIIYL